MKRDSKNIVFGTLMVDLELDLERLRSVLNSQITILSGRPPTDEMARQILGYLLKTGDEDDGAEPGVDQPAIVNDFAFFKQLETLDRSDPAAIRKLCRPFLLRYLILEANKMLEEAEKMK
jgi:hypothetical protein